MPAGGRWSAASSWRRRKHERERERGGPDGERIGRCRGAARGPRPAHDLLRSRIVLRSAQGSRHRLGARRRRRHARSEEGRGARRGRGVGVRQDDAGADPARPRRGDGGVDRARGRGDHGSQGIGAPADAAAHADRLPGPTRLAEPGDDDRRARRRSAALPQARLRPRGASRPRGRGARARRPRARRGVPRQVPGRPLRRAEAAGRAGPGDHSRPRRPGRRRARLDARHERPGEDPRADARAQGRARPHLRLHHPRPGDGKVLLRPDRDHVPRSNRRAGAGGGDLRESLPPLHGGAAAGDPRARSAPRCPPRPAPWRGPRCRDSAARLLVPPALPAGVRGLRLGVARPADAAGGSLDPPHPG